VHVVLTGASSGIGRALALAYAGRGAALSLIGRDGRRLDEVAAACQAHGAASVRAAALDVRDAEALGTWLLACDDALGVDLVIANAGIGGGPGVTAHAIFAVNVLGVVATVQPLLPRLVTRRQGTVVLMSSLAAFRAYPPAPAYAASKAAVRVWGQGLRARLCPHGVRVAILYPGFVDTELTRRNRFAMPLLMGAEKAAGIIVARLAGGHAEIAFPWPMALAARAAAFLPAGLADRLTRHIPPKE